MSDEAWKTIGIAIMSLYGLYAAEHDYPLLARIWDYMAVMSAILADFFGRLALAARVNYLEAVKYV